MAAIKGPDGDYDEDPADKARSPLCSDVLRVVGHRQLLASTAAGAHAGSRTVGREAQSAARIDTIVSGPANVDSGSDASGCHERKGGADGDAEAQRRLRRRARWWSIRRRSNGSGTVQCGCRASRASVRYTPKKCPAHTIGPVARAADRSSVAVERSCDGPRGTVHQQEAQQTLARRVVGEEREGIEGHAPGVVKATSHEAGDRVEADNHHGGNDLKLQTDAK